jgi:hypothetical protein
MTYKHSDHTSQQHLRRLLMLSMHVQHAQKEKDTIFALLSLQDPAHDIQGVQHQHQAAQMLQHPAPPTQHPYPTLGLQALEAMQGLHLQV